MSRGISNDKIQEAKEVLRRYPADEYELLVIINEKEIEGMLNSKASCHWGQYKITENYYRLGQYSPEHEGDKPVVIICANEKVEKIRQKTI